MPSRSCAGSISTAWPSACVCCRRRPMTGARSMTINSGSTLTLGAGGTTGSVPGAITDNGVLAINHSDNFIVNNVSGSGQLQQTGPGVTTLGSGLSYTGGTVINAGTLVVNNPAALGSGGLTISGGELLAGTTETISNHPLTLSGSFNI